MKKGLKSIGLLIILIIITCIVLPKESISLLTFREILVFSIIGFISIMQLTKEFRRASYSLNIMHWIFILFFFFIVPIIQISFQFHAWGIAHSKDETFFSCVLILIWIIGYIAGNYFSNRKHLKYKERKQISIEDITTQKLIAITFISIICAILLVGYTGLGNMFARSTSNINYEGSNYTMVTLLIGNCTRTVIVFSTALMILNYQKRKKNLVLLIINIIILLITCFPTGLARNSTAAIYIGIFIICIYKNIDKFSKSPIYIYLFVLAFMIIFPSINAFRQNELFEVNIFNTVSKVSKNITQNYLSEDYDAFSIIADVGRYINTNGITNGRQFLGAFLFFIPRNIWVNKPYGSGHTVFKYFKENFTNVSCPLLAECYINFGVLGVAIFSVIIGFIISYIDRKYWTKLREQGAQYSYIIILYPFLLGQYFFMLRGDLMSTWAYMSTYIVIFCILDRLLKVKIKI